MLKACEAEYGEEKGRIPPPDDDEHEEVFGLERLLEDFKFNLTVGTHKSLKSYLRMVNFEYNTEDFFTLIDNKA